MLASAPGDVTGYQPPPPPPPPPPPDPPPEEKPDEPDDDGTALENAPLAPATLELTDRPKSPLDQPPPPRQVG